MRVNCSGVTNYNTLPTPPAPSQVFSGPGPLKTFSTSRSPSLQIEPRRSTDQGCLSKNIQWLVPCHARAFLAIRSILTGRCLFLCVTKQYIIPTAAMGVFFDDNEDPTLLIHSNSGTAPFQLIGASLQV